MAELPLPSAGADPRAGYRLGLLLLTGAAIAWSSAGLFTRLIAAETWSMLVWRGLFAAAGLLAVLLTLEGRAGLRGFQRLGSAGWLFVGVSAAGMACFMFSLRLTTVAHVSVIYATAPLVAAGLGWLALRERPSPRALAASLVALVGVAVMVGPGVEGSPVGDLLAFGMTLAMATIMVIARARPNLPITAAACLSALAGAVLSLPFAETLAITLPDLALTAVFGLINLAAGLALFTVGARLLPPVETALVGSLEVPLAPLLVWAALGETPAPATLIGGAVVFVAVTAHVLGEARRRQDGLPRPDG